MHHSYYRVHYRKLSWNFVGVLIEYVIEEFWLLARLMGICTHFMTTSDVLSVCNAVIVFLMPVLNFITDLYGWEKKETEKMEQDKERIKIRGPKLDWRKSGRRRAEVILLLLGKFRLYRQESKWKETATTESFSNWVTFMRTVMYGCACNSQSQIYSNCLDVNEIYNVLGRKS